MMINPHRKPVAAIVLATLVAGAVAPAQNASEPLVFAAQVQTVQQQLNALKAQVASLQATDASLKNQISALRTSNAVLEASDSNLKRQIASLQSNNTALQAQVKSLKTGNMTLESQVGTLQSQLAVVRANPALSLGPFVRVDPDPEVGVTGPNVVFTGVNIHLLSGSGTTNDNGIPRGLGNLIIGYDEDPAQVSENTLQPGDRGGSHNLIIGRFNRFTRASFGGFVAGEVNTISNGAASVTGGGYNTASGPAASVTGGVGNTASGPEASVTGGDSNTASGSSERGATSVTGGIGNTASDLGASVSGGRDNTASGYSSSIIGGFQNTAGGVYSVVLGGTNVINNVDNSIAPKPPFLP